jgi:pilus assembly protein Flp/PilA
VPSFAKRLATALGITSESGVTAIEYALLAALIAIAIITAVTLLGTNLTATFNTVAGKVVVPAS